MQDAATCFVTSITLPSDLKDPHGGTGSGPTNMQGRGFEDPILNRRASGRGEGDD